MRRMKTVTKDEWGILIFLVTLFLIIFFVFGYQAGWDSVGYMMLHPMREPVYPLFLWMLRVFDVFGENARLYVASFLQNIFAAVIVWYAICRIAHSFFYVFWQKVMTGLFLLIPYVLPFVMGKLIGGDEVMYSCSILSEALTIPLFELWFVLLAGYASERGEGGRYRQYGTVMLIALLLSFCRGQMMELILITALVGIFVAREYKSSFFVPVVLAVLAFICISLVTHLYHFEVHGKWMGNTFGPMNLAATAVYVSDEEDARLFEDNELKENYILVSSLAKKKGYTISSAPKGLLGIAEHAENAHDDIKYKVLNPILLEGDQAADGASVDARIKRDETVKTMSHILLPAHIKEWSKVYMGYFLVGVIRSVAINRAIFYPYVVMVLFMAIVLPGRCLYQNKDAPAVRWMVLALVVLFVNAAAVSVFIMPVFRYTIYIWSVFYLSGFMLFVELYKKNGENKA